MLGFGLGHGLGPRPPGDDESGSCEGLGLGASRDGFEASDNRFVGVSGGDSMRDRRLSRDEASAAAGLEQAAGSLRPGTGSGDLRPTEGGEAAMAGRLSDDSALARESELRAQKPEKSRSSGTKGGRVSVGRLLGQLEGTRDRLQAVTVTKAEGAVRVDGVRGG